LNKNIICFEELLDILILAKTAKFVYLHFPICVLLFVNLVVFVRAILDLTKIDREKRRFNLRSSRDRNPKMEQ